MNRPQAFGFLRLGEIKPLGWLRAQMTRDLEHGFVGHLDELVPDLIQKDDIYGADRLTKSARTKELGVVAKESQWEVQFLWWNSETQSNWRDGWVRSAVLLDHPGYLEKVRAYIDRILSTQDADGYLGIYAPDLRFNFTGENGELWAQASLFRVLLGWYEAIGEPRVLEAVRRAVEVTMHAYPVGQSHPFDIQDDFAGVGHGLIFTDILDQLHHLTGEPHYLDYARWLYDEYSRQPLSQDDIQLAHLLDTEYRFKAHGVHTYEHLRSLLTAAYASSDPQLDTALEACLAKLESCLTPSGAPIGDEFIGGRQADAGQTGYEYCSIHELLASYVHLLQKTGTLRWADCIEWLLFNAGQGARHPSESGIAYLKTDNSFSMIGPLHPENPQDPHNPQIRYKYSPAHQDVAVCCVPNAGRIYPYYVRSMFLRTPEGFLAALYGACELKTKFNDVAVTITEQTNYPFEHEIIFGIDVSRPVEFELAFRRPAWTNGFSIRTEGEWCVENGLIKIRKTWHPGEQVILCFRAETRINRFRDDESFVSYGPLVFALPLEGQERTGREYPLAGFRDLYYFPTEEETADLMLEQGTEFTLEQGPFESDQPWKTSLALTGEAYDLSLQQSVPVRLIPMGGTVLRKVTFTAPEA